MDWCACAIRSSLPLTSWATRLERSRFCKGSSALMSNWWDKQIQRADQLIPKANGSKELLTFYAHLLRAQRDVYEFLCSRPGWLPSGNLESDLPVLADSLPAFLKIIEAHGPATLA